MSAQPVIAFVNGVDRRGAKPPKNFPCRFAVLTWFAHDDGVADPWPLFRATIPRVGALVDADSIMAEYWHSRSTGILFRRFEETLVAEVAWAGLMHVDDEALNQQTFPHRIRFSADDKTRLIAVTEPWNMVGGPPPYHDSVTVSFFSDVQLNQEIQDIFTQEASKLNIPIQELNQHNNSTHTRAGNVPI